ncbi:XrtA/PEP-CTERM system TPR-repeat protein PrsT [Paucibacter sp. KCTC 42545]|uniref:XrtA/PEP-CTERM system TPR-repeat protein PrsT n=1 Tax=Paucibacter sp. KCTC 42545 TaxID=1768242 RepID=UPI000733BBE5|nr:XrtA/PEP-CTERM system TPR-repeat protein PrsT [Paucibacter sp. KCTC 42545]ALT78614.1 hypothetical protein AT984_16870 [Paucibacter sp. KCTC 42545]
MPFIRVVFLLIWLAALQACGQRADADLLADARRQIAAKEYSVAQVTLKGGLQVKENWPEARHLLGVAYLEAGNGQDAVIELRKALSADQPLESVLPQLARAMVLAGQSKDLIAGYAGTQLQSPAAVAEFTTALYQAYRAQNDTDKAEQALQAALRAKPDYAPARLLRARAEAARGQPDGALAIVDAVIAADKHNAQAWVLKGELLQIGKRDDSAAVQAYESALKEDPRALMAHQQLTMMALTANQGELAQTRLTAMSKAWPGHPQTLLFEAQMALRANDIKTAREKLQLALKASPNDVLGLALAAELESRAGAVAQAESHLAKALAIAPNSIVQTLQLAQLQVLAGDSAKALATVTPLLGMPAPPPLALAIGARAHVQLGNFKQAEKLFEQASKAAPGDERFRIGQALAKLSRGEDAQSMLELERMSAQGGSNLPDLALANLKQHNNDSQGALAMLDRAQSKQPKDPVPLLQRGHLLLQKGDLVAARAAFEQAAKIDPQSWPAVEALAQADAASGNVQAAVQGIQAWLLKHPKDAGAHLTLAGWQERADAPPQTVQASIRAAISAAPAWNAPQLALIRWFLSQGDAQAALTAAQVAVNALPTDRSVLAQLGHAQLAAGQTSQAVRTFKRVSDVQAKDPAAWVDLAAAHQAAKEPAEARKKLKQALALDGSFLAAHRGLVALALEAQDWAAAQTQSQQVQVLLPKQPEGWTWEGDTLALQKKWGAAAVAYRSAQSKAARSDTALRLHAVLLSDGRRADADQYERDWLAAHAGDLEFREGLARGAMARGDLPEAERLYRDELAQVPERVSALNNLAWLLVQQRKSGALSLAEQANKLAPNQAPLLDTWAAALVYEGQFAKALEIQQKAVQLAPSASLLQLHLAQIALQAGDKALAKTALNRLTEMAPGQATPPEVEQLRAALR